MIKSIKTNYVSLFILSLTSAFQSFAIAETVTSQFQSNVTLTSACVVSTRDVNFGNIVLTSTSNMITATGELDLLCSNQASVTIDLIGGNGGLVTGIGTRYMLGSSGNSDQLIYGIYRPVGFGPGVQGPGQWGNVESTPAAHIVVITTGSEQSYPLTGRLNTNQVVKPDNYTDTLTASLSF